VLAATSRDLLHGLAAGTDVTRAVTDLAHEPTLTARAQAVNTLCQVHAAGTGDLGSWVDGADLVNNRSIALPNHARAVLVDHADQVALASGAVRSAAGPLHGPVGWSTADW
jgi:hypothetical protein